MYEATIDRPLVDLRTGADYLNVSHRTLYQWARDGKVPAYRVGGIWRLRLDELEVWLQDQRLEASP